MQEKEISSKIAYEGNNFRVRLNEVKLPDGQIVTREVCEYKHSSVAIVVLDSEQNILLVKGFRTGLGKDRLEIPGGRFYPSQGETPEEAAIRECREEVGVEPRKMELLFEIEGGGSWVMHTYLFLATDLRLNPLPRDPDEFLEVIKMPFREYLKLQLERKHQARGGEFQALILTARKLGLLDIKT